MAPYGPIEEAIQRSAELQPESSDSNSRIWWIVLALLVGAGATYLAITSVNKNQQPKKKPE